ncbi:twin-arginine translocation signal domain-containing protein [Natronorubrum halophilum]|uniref:twin-arginine translocation signal domain-containing protein n=1 Tax=Natronorubrum halophilum TaxID=1702106 RepID=UPI0010C1DF39|nr:twin-arginine translocation signal domain-containing protein [Natronorubrum halophilum]
MTRDTNGRDANERTRSNRRQFLHTAGATTAVFGLSAVGAATVTASDESDSVTVLTGSYDSPVETDAVDAIDKTVERAATDRDEPTPLARSEPAGKTDSSELVAYMREMGDDGVVREYRGVTETPGSASLLHERAKRRATALERRDSWESQRGFDRNQLSTQDLDIENMERIYENHLETVKEPFGVVGTWIDWYHTRDEDRAVNAITQRVAMEPGTQLWGSTWGNNDGFAETDWSNNEIGGEELNDWEPFGTQDGSVNKSVSVSASLSSSPSLSASVSWTYSQPALMVEDQTSFHENKNHWFFDANTGATETSTIGIRPGSICYTNLPTCEWKQVCQVKTIGTFFEESTFHDHHETFGHHENLSVQHC